MEWTTPWTSLACSRTRSTSCSRSSALVTSSWMTGASWGSRRAVTSVSRNWRPKEVRMTRAPCSWASRATWKAIELSFRTPVTSSVFPARIPMFSLSVSAAMLVAHPKPAVHRDHRAGHVTGLRGAEEAHRGHHVGHLTETSGGDGAEIGLLAIFGQCLGHVGVNGSGGHHIRGDSPAAQFAGDGASHADEAGFGCGVIRLPGRAIGGYHRRHEDDSPATLADHAAHGTACAAEGAGEVDVDDLSEFFVAHPHEELVTRHSGVGDEHLNGAVLLFDGGEGLIDRGGVAHVASHAQYSGRQVTAAVNGGDVVTGGEEIFGNRSTDSACRAGHQHAARGSLAFCHSYSLVGGNG